MNKAALESWSSQASTPNRQQVAPPKQREKHAKFMGLRQGEREMARREGVRAVSRGFWGRALDTES